MLRRRQRRRRRRSLTTLDDHLRDVLLLLVPVRIRIRILVLVLIHESLERVFGERRRLRGDDLRRL